MQFNFWNNDFYNTLQNKDQAEFFRQLGKFGLLALTFIVTAVYRLYFLQMLMIEWRTWLTEHFLQNWMKDQAYYRMQLLDRGTDNPDQRIADDLRLFVDLTLSLSLGLLSAVVTLVSFLGILWTLSGALEIAGVSIPGYMVWVALVYAIAGTWLTHVIGRALIGLDFNQQRYEADFRFSLVRLRENSEGVALYRGEREELGRFRERFGAVIAQLVVAHAQAEAARLVHLVLCADGDHLSLYRGVAALLLRRNPARRHLPDRLGLQPGSGIAVVVHQRLHHVCAVEGDRGPPDRLPGRARARAPRG